MTSSTKDINQKLTFNGIQALRFFAAFLVVLTHATFYVSTRMDNSFPIWKDGAQGVSIFFVISGFVMLISSRSFLDYSGGAQQFMLMRIIRIVPLYWTVMLTKLLIFFIIPTAIFSNFDYINLLLSFFFIPSFNSNNQIEPFYGVGWTLNFEMFFYAIFTLSIYLKLRAVWFVGSILVLLSMASIFRQPDWPAVSFLLNPIVLLFFYGMIIAEIYLYAKLYIPKLVSFSMFLFGLIVTFFLPSFSIFGIHYGFLVAGVVFLEPVINKKIPALLIFGGNASYSLYLIHPMIGPAITAMLLKLNLNTPILAIYLIILTSFSAASIIYIFFEHPLSLYLKKQFVSPLSRRIKFMDVTP